MYLSKLSAAGNRTQQAWIPALTQALFKAFLPAGSVQLLTYNTSTKLLPKGAKISFRVKGDKCFPWLLPVAPAS